MLLRHLSKTAQLAGVKLWNVSLGDFQTNAINVILQNRKQNGQHTNKGYRQNKPIISCRVRPRNFRLCDPSRGDSWYLKHVNEARRRKNKTAERQKESVSQALKTKFHFCFQGQAMNIWEGTLSSQLCPSSQQGPKSFGLTVPFPAYWFPPWYRLFMAEERQGCSRQGRDPKSISGEVPWH